MPDTLSLSSRAEHFMAMLFRVCRKGSPARWAVMVEGQLYGEYVDKEQALLDAVEAATEAHDTGQDAEVWDGAGRVY